MPLQGVSGMAVAATAGGAMLIWSGVKGANFSKTFQSLIAGKQPAGQDPAQAITASFDSTGGSSGSTSAAPASGGSNKAVLQQVAASFGWTGAEWTALDYVEMREAGYSLTAKNSSSGAYGMAQFINGPSEYAQYGGDSSTAFGQSVGMCNYIKQRYGKPSVAAAHERQSGWY